MHLCHLYSELQDWHLFLQCVNATLYTTGCLSPPCCTMNHIANCLDHRFPSQSSGMLRWATVHISQPNRTQPEHLSGVLGVWIEPKSGVLNNTFETIKYLIYVEAQRFWERAYKLTCFNGRVFMKTSLSLTSYPLHVQCVVRKHTSSVLTGTRDERSRPQ